MKRSVKFTVGFAVALMTGLAVDAAARPEVVPETMMMQGAGPGMMQGMMQGRGPGMMMQGMGSGMTMRTMEGPMGRMRSGDPAFGADMQLVHEMLLDHDEIRRTVTNLPDGIRTVTESDDPQIAQLIKAHVGSMEQRLREGRIFNLFSPTLPVLFENKDSITTVVETTERGAVVTQTSKKAIVVSALQAHAMEVSDLARGGMVAMMRAARENAMGGNAHR